MWGVGCVWLVEEEGVHIKKSKLEKQLGGFMGQE